MTAVEAADKPTEGPPGRIIIKFLQEARGGATLSEILSHLQTNYGKENSDELNRTVEKILENGAALGFLERKGSHYLNWEPREMACGRRRRRARSCCRRRRQRRIRRRRSCCCRRRRRRKHC
ncbi:unnamed protein product [Parnassius mnemosyne]|uniref:DUF4777 domain-containing protein n=1 Tax=Parnassius mnemosyne TaxID=213953 RepID=A0AAV1L2J8_9NEOP